MAFSCLVWNQFWRNEINISVLTNWQATVVPDTEINYNYCVYDSDISTGLGIGAFLFLMASQVLIMVASRCFCCGKPLNPGGSRALAVVLFIVCWYIRTKVIQHLELSNVIYLYLWYRYIINHKKRERHKNNSMICLCYKYK